MTNDELVESIDFFFLNDFDEMGINPATQLSQEEYQSFLEPATSEELESNIMTKDTYKKVKGIKNVYFNYMGI